MGHSQAVQGKRAARGGGRSRAEDREERKRLEQSVECGREAGQTERYRGAKHVGAAGGWSAAPQGQPGSRGSLLMMNGQSALLPRRGPVAGAAPAWTTPRCCCPKAAAQLRRRPPCRCGQQPPRCCCSCRGAGVSASWRRPSACRAPQRRQGAEAAPAALPALQGKRRSGRVQWG